MCYTFTFYTKRFLCAGLLGITLFVASCRQESRVNADILEDAIRADEKSQMESANDSMPLPIQTSPYTAPVKQVPKQEELIASLRVKSVRQSYEDGWTLTVYDKKGHKLSEESDFSGKKTYSYTFDDKGRITQEKTKYKDGSVFTTTCAYDEAGRLSHKTFTDDEGKTSETIIAYDPKLNTRKEVSALGTDKEFYDNRGLRVRFESYDEKHKLVGYGETTYGEDGLAMEETSRLLGFSIYDVMTYNEKGQLLERHRSGMLNVYFRFEYNENGLLRSETTVKDGREEKTSYEYKFY